MKKLNFIRVAAASVLLVFAATASPADWDDNDGETGPTAEGVTFDLLIARPLGVIGTGVGAVLFVALLPFTIAVGAPPKESAETLVLQPFNWTFVRPLGK